MKDTLVTVTCSACDTKKTFTVQHGKPDCEPSGWWWLRARKDPAVAGIMIMKLICSAECVEKEFVQYLRASLADTSGGGDLYLPQAGRLEDDKQSA